MNIVIPIIIIAVISILTFCLYMGVGKIKDLEKAKRILRAGEEMNKQTSTGNATQILTVIFTCRECNSEMEVFRKGDFIKIVCPNCRHTKKLKILF